MKFTKMQGIGNDYVYINCFEEQVESPERLAVKISDRHFGVGSDGLILICPSDAADCRMKMFNADGSEGAMCGNAIRCVGKYVYDHKIVDKKIITVETKGGIKTLDMTVENGKVTLVRVDMGEPVLTSGLPENINILGEDYQFVGISVGIEDMPGGLSHMRFLRRGGALVLLYQSPLEKSRRAGTWERLLAHF